MAGALKAYQNQNSPSPDYKGDVTGTPIGAGTGRKNSIDVTVNHMGLTSMLTAIDSGDSDLLYVGYCLPGDVGKTGEEVWAIKRVLATSVPQIRWADGSLEFIKEWDERENLAYEV